MEKRYLSRRKAVVIALEKTITLLDFQHKSPAAAAGQLRGWKRLSLLRSRGEEKKMSNNRFYNYTSKISDFSPHLFCSGIDSVFSVSLLKVVSFIWENKTSQSPISEFSQKCDSGFLPSTSCHFVTLEWLPMKNLSIQFVPDFVTYCLPQLFFRKEHVLLLLHDQQLSFIHLVFSLVFLWGWDSVWESLLFFAQTAGVGNVMLTSIFVSLPMGLTTRSVTTTRKLLPNFPE